MIAKGRQRLRTAPIGESNPNAKLTDEQIAEIKYLYETLSQRELAKRFNVSKSQIGNIVRGESRNIPTIPKAPK
jgi:transcriptional regulator with XRE-family HTH domain